jgi:hypothetical protein
VAGRDPGVDYSLGEGREMIQLKVNGVEQSFSGEPEMPLLWYLRDVFKNSLSEDQIHSLVAHVRSLHQKK